MSDFEAINSVGAFLRVVKHFYPENSPAFFRGQGSSEHDVNSSFYRLLDKNSYKDHPDNYSYMLARELFREFKKNMPAYEEVHSLKSYTLNDLDHIMVAQHYGLETRLIDWSKNPLVALYFATERAKIDRTCSVFMLFNCPGGQAVSLSNSDSFTASLLDEQVRLQELRKLIENQHSKTIDLEFFNKIHSIIDKYTSPDFITPPIKIHPVIIAMNAFQAANMMRGEPVHKLIKIFDNDSVNTVAPLSAVTIHNDCHYIIEPLPLNPRIKNQQGVFLFSNDISKPVFQAKENFTFANTITSDDPVSLAEKSGNSGVLRIDIPGDLAIAIHRELNLYGVTKDFIYPELTSFTEVMRNRVVANINRMLPKN